MDPIIADKAAPDVTTESSPVTETTEAQQPDTEQSAQPEETESGTVETPEITEATKGAEPSEAEKRIKQLVAKQRDAERIAAYWQGVAEGRTKPPDQEETKRLPNGEEVAPVRPDVAQFADYSDYEEARDAYLVEKAKYEYRQEQRAIAQAQERQTIEKGFTERIQKVAETRPEILDIIKDDTLPVSPLTADLIRHSDAGPDIVFYLNENREEALRIAQMHPILAAKEIGRIEAKLLAPKPVTPTPKISQAPDPITVGGTRGTPAVDLDNISTKEFMERRNREQFGTTR